MLLKYVGDYWTEPSRLRDVPNYEYALSTGMWVEQTPEEQTEYLKSVENQVKLLKVQAPCKGCRKKIESLQQLLASKQNQTAQKIEPTPESDAGVEQLPFAEVVQDGTPIETLDDPLISVNEQPQDS